MKIREKSEKIKEKSTKINKNQRKIIKGIKDHLLEANKTVHVYAQVHSSIYIYIHMHIHR